MKELTQSQEKILSDLQSVKDKLTTLHIEKTKAEDQLSTISTQLTQERNNFQEEIRKKTIEIEKFATKEAVLNDELEKFKASNEEQKIKFNHQEQELKEQITQAQTVKDQKSLNELQQLVVQVAESKKELQAAQAKLTEKEAEWGQEKLRYQHDIETLQSTNEKLTAEVNALPVLKNEVNRLKEMLDNFKGNETQKQNLQKQLNVKENELLRTTSELENVKKELADAISKAQKDNGIFQEEVQALTQSQQNIANTLKKVQAELNSAQDARLKAEKDLKNNSQNNIEQNEGLIDKEREIKKLKTQQSQLQTELEQSKKSNEDKQKVITQQEKILNEQKIQAQILRDLKSKSAIEHLENALENTKKELQRANAKIDQKEAELEQATKTINSKDAELSGLQTKLADSVEEKKQMEAKMKTLTDRLEKLDESGAQDRKTTEEMLRLEREKNILSKQLGEKTQNIDELNKNLERVQEDLTKTQNELSEARTAIEKLNGVMNKNIHAQNIEDIKIEDIKTLWSHTHSNATSITHATEQISYLFQILRTQKSLNDDDVNQVKKRFLSKYDDLLKHVQEFPGFDANSQLLNLPRLNFESLNTNYSELAQQLQQQYTKWLGKFQNAPNPLSKNPNPLLPPVRLKRESTEDYAGPKQNHITEKVQFISNVFHETQKSPATLKEGVGQIKTNTNSHEARISNVFHETQKSPATLNEGVVQINTLLKLLEDSTLFPEDITRITDYFLKNYSALLNLTDAVKLDPTVDPKVDLQSIIKTYASLISYLSGKKNLQDLAVKVKNTYQKRANDTFNTTQNIPQSKDDAMKQLETLLKLMIDVNLPPQYIASIKQRFLERYQETLKLEENPYYAGIVHSDGMSFLSKQPNLQDVVEQMKELYLNYCRQVFNEANKNFNNVHEANGQLENLLDLLQDAYFSDQDISGIKETIKKSFLKKFGQLINNVKSINYDNLVKNLKEERHLPELAQEVQKIYDDYVKCNNSSRSNSPGTGASVSPRRNSQTIQGNASNTSLENPDVKQKITNGSSMLTSTSTEASVSTRNNSQTDQSNTLKNAGGQEKTNNDDKKHLELQAILDTTASEPKSSDEAKQQLETLLDLLKQSKPRNYSGPTIALFKGNI